MPILTHPDQVRDWDAATLAAQSLTSADLMERAAAALAEAFARDYPLPAFERVDLLCGPGDNGGDGAAVARKLEALGYTTRVYGYWPSDDVRSPDLRANWQRLEKQDHPRLHANVDWPAADYPDVVVDALFGVGLNRALEGAFAEAVRTVNAAREATGLPVVSVDVPSGQRIDGSAPEWPCVRAARTYTFQAPKYSMLLRETGPAWGGVGVLDIRLAPPPASVVASGASLLRPRDFAEAFAQRAPFTHKGTYGHVLVLAGSRGHAGAALLCARGAYRGGAGLVTAYVPAALEQTIQLGLPEAMCLRDPREDYLTRVPDLAPFDAVVVGPGLGQHDATRRMLAELFAAAGETPVVLDADALNLVAVDPDLRAALPSRAVLTPHPGEFRRWVGEWQPGRDYHDRLRALARALGGDGDAERVVVLKGQYTCVAVDGESLSFNVFRGNPGMATGGSGDVLAGVIAGLLAQGHAPRVAAGAGVLAHAAAGDLAAPDFGEAGLLAGDIADRIGLALARLSSAGPSDG